VNLLEANVDKMPLINLLEYVGKEVVSVQLGYIANGKLARVCGDPWSGGSFGFMFDLLLFCLFSLVSTFLFISTF
jgi:hypothetical protein